MTPEELVDDMANKTEYDDAYITATGKMFADMGLDGLKRFMAAFNEKRATFTEAQKQNISTVNLALAKNEDFSKALRDFHDWKATQAPKAEDGP